eukprot:623239_1
MAAILDGISWLNECYARNEALFQGVMETSPNGIVGNQWFHTHVRITQDVRIISELKQRFKDASSHSQNNWSVVELRVLALKDRAKTLFNRGQIKEAQIIYDTILGMLTQHAQNETCKGLLAIIHCNLAVCARLDEDWSTAFILHHISRKNYLMSKKRLKSWKNMGWI